jgi:hypothetical protein
MSKCPGCVYAEGLVTAAQDYMSQFGQALEAHGIPYGPAQVEADEKLRAALAEAPVASIPTGTNQFVCCGASDPSCTDFDGSCKNPANYPPAKPAADEYTPGCNFPRCVCPDGKECSK